MTVLLLVAEKKFDRFEAWGFCHCWLCRWREPPGKEGRWPVRLDSGLLAHSQQENQDLMSRATKNWILLTTLLSWEADSSSQPLYESWTCSLNTVFSSEYKTQSNLLKKLTNRTTNNKWLKYFQSKCLPDVIFLPQSKVSSLHYCHHIAILFPLTIQW